MIVLLIDVYNYNMCLSILRIKDVKGYDFEKWRVGESVMSWILKMAIYGDNGTYYQSYTGHS